MLEISFISRKVQKSNEMSALLNFRYLLLKAVFLRKGSFVLYQVYEQLSMRLI